MIPAIPSFANASVLVVGDVMLDRYWKGDTSRMSPEAPVPVVGFQNVEDRAGGAANVAANLVALGCKAGLLGVIGNDEAGENLSQLLLKQGVDARFVQYDAAPTITKLRVLSRQQQLLRVDFEEKHAPFDQQQFQTQFAEMLSAYDVVVFSDYAKGALHQVQPLIAAAKAAGKYVVVDPKGCDFTPYMGADLITPNMSEFEGVVGPCADEELPAKAETLRQNLSLTALLVTRSEKGMSLVTDGAIEHIPTQALEVFDVTGAGDTVIATFAACMANVSFSEAMKVANLAAGVVVGKVGTATVSQAELQAAAVRYWGTGTGVLSELELITVVHAATESAEKIVMTNGCFDILHVGHIRYLQEARSLGDRLIVAVNDDASVKRLKGETRPINGVAERMEMLASLECVDWVVDFSEDTPQRLIEVVSPNILVKGGDYKPEDIAGFDHVMDNGGQVMVLTFHDGHSTSKIIERSRQ